MPSVAALVVYSVLSPHPAATSAAAARTAARAVRARLRVIGAGRLQPGDRGPLPALAALFEDRAQPLEGLARAPLPPSAAAREDLHEPVRGQGRLRLVHELHARPG